MVRFPAATRRNWYGKGAGVADEGSVAAALAELDELSKGEYGLPLEQLLLDGTRWPRSECSG